jgi:hypothetical protein
MFLSCVLLFSSTNSTGNNSALFDRQLSLSSSNILLEAEKTSPVVINYGEIMCRFAI